MNRMVQIVVILLAILTCSEASAQVTTRHHVDAAAAPGGDGIAWATAFNDLQDAIFAAVSTTGSDQIWVAAGTYKPDSGSDRTASFVLEPDIRIIGGFAVGDDELTDRDPIANPTILSGALGSGNFSYHVVRADGVPFSAVLEGFTIRDGLADGSALLAQNSGAGLFINCASPSIVNCRFTNNICVDGFGGAVRTFGGIPCIEEGDATTGPIFLNCTFDDNHANISGSGGGSGGAMSNLGRVKLANCLFFDNVADGDGSGGGSGGAIYNAGSDAFLALTNCTFSDNAADGATGAGGAIYTTTGTVEGANCILWGNTDALSTQIYVDSGTASFTYSDIQGSYTGTGNKNVDPGFATGSYRLTSGSECINTGNFTLFTGAPDTFDIDRDGQGSTEYTPDLDLMPRMACCQIDMGAYEFACTMCYCSGDISGPSGHGASDCNVDALDFLLLIAEWGSPCVPGANGICDADITGPTAGVPDGNVDSLDFLLLLGQWGSPGNCPTECSSSMALGGGGSEKGLSEEDWQTLLVEVQSTSEARRARGLCWMLHYLSGCVESCEFDGCGSEDPLARH